MHTIQKELMMGFCVLLVLMFVASAKSVIVIDGVFDPHYVQVGRELRLRCRGSQIKMLKWKRSTPETMYKYVDIVPNEKDTWKTRVILKQPESDVENVLINTDVQLHDYGTYKCLDGQELSDYSLFVIPLKLKVSELNTTKSSKEFVLSCLLSGFRSNVPDLVITWAFEQRILKQSNHYRMSENEFSQFNLTVINPGAEDTGVYTCMVNVLFHHNNRTADWVQLMDTAHVYAENSACNLSWKNFSVRKLALFYLAVFIYFI